jgi:predicted transcriptional regulator
MRVDQIMSRPVHSCRPDDSLARAAWLMWEHDCGCLPVISGDGTARVIGMITDRDICMCALFEKQSLGELRVSSAMAKQVRACRPTDELPAVDEIMRSARLRRLPVIDDDGVLVGMVALADLAREALRERGTPVRDITEGAIGYALAGICQPQHRELSTYEAANVFGARHVG